MAGIVVLHLVVVPRHGPGTGRVGGLQGRVALVQRVAVTVVGQRGGQAQAVRARQAVGTPGARVFVDVVAQEQHQVRLVGHHMAPGRIVAMFPTLARRKGEAQRGGQVPGGRGRARAARGADGIAQHETVVVPAARRQAAQLHMHAVAERWHSRGFALVLDLCKPRIARHLPAHGVGGQHLRRVGQRQPGPQYHAIGCRVATGNAQREGVRWKRRRVAPRPSGQGSGRCGECRALQKSAPQLRSHCGVPDRCLALNTGAARANGRRARGAPPRWRLRGEGITPPSPGSCPIVWPGTCCGLRG